LQEIKEAYDWREDSEIGIQESGKNEFKFVLQGKRNRKLGDKDS